MSDGPKPQILVVGDEPAVRESLGMLLESVGYDVAMAANGISALGQIARAVPDLIVTDLNMPDDWHGADFTRTKPLSHDVERRDERRLPGRSSARRTHR